MMKTNIKPPYRFFTMLSCSGWSARLLSAGWLSKLSIVLALFVLYGLGLATCSSSSYTRGGNVDSVTTGVYEESMDEDASVADGEGTVRRKESPKRDSTDPDEPSPVQKERLMIYEARLASQVNELEQAIAGTRQLIERYQARVESQSINKEAATASFKIRVPVKNFDALVAALGQLGELQSRQIKAQDITKQYGDLVAQLANRRQLLDRLYVILKKTNSTRQRIRILNEIARLEKEIDSMEARRKFLASQANFSTVYWQMTAAKKLAVQPGTLLAWLRDLRPNKRTLMQAPRFALPLPAGFIDNRDNYDASSEALFSSPEGVLVRTATIENDPLGDAAFYKAALEYERQRYPARPAQLQQKANQLDLLTAWQSGYQAAWYQLHMRVDGDVLHIVEVYYPDKAALDKHRQAVTDAIQQITPLSTWAIWLQQLW
ncbi:MAG: DUF4349 domain-containing protein [Leptospiraceae bacterium]|nr:DUF4349 domain-containing protein [Leptospiraceae bacterium]